MTDPNHGKPGQRPGGGGPNATSAPAGSGASRENDPGAGKVVHDSRGNAVWEWFKDAGRHAIESTSALLKRLEMPELKVEDQKDTELRLEDDVDKGGGYDPYGSRVGARKPTERKTLPPISKKR